MILFLKKLINKFKVALDGFVHGMIHDQSISIQCVIGLLVVLAGVWLRLNQIEWLWVSVMILIVIGFEFLNSAIEMIVDMISPEYDIRAKRIKDYAAAAVLIISTSALLVALLILNGGLR